MSGLTPETLLFLMLEGLGSLYYCQRAYMYSEKEALNIATEALQKYSDTTGLNMDLFEQPVRTKMNIPWSFEWRYNGPEKKIVGVWINESGGVELYSE